MDPFIKVITENVVNVLMPLIDTFEDDFGIKGIRVTTFGSISEIDDLIENYLPLMPGAFLSTPTISYPEMTQIRTINPVLSYRLLIGISNRWSEELKQEFIFKMHDLTAEKLFLKEISVAGTNASSIDFLRPTSWEVGNDFENKHLAFLLTFDVNVRNWKIFINNL